MTSVADVLNNIVPISDFNHGKAGKAFARVEKGNPLIVLKHNAPEAVIISPSEYESLIESREDLELLRQAQQRMDHDSGKRLTLKEALGDDYEPVDDDFKVEFE